MKQHTRPSLLKNYSRLLRRALLSSCILMNGTSSLIFGSGYLTDIASSSVIYSQSSAQPYGPYSVVFNAVIGGSESYINCYIDQNASTEYDDSISAIQLTLGTNTSPFLTAQQMFSLTTAMFKGGSIIANTPFVVHLKSQNNSKKKLLPLPSSTNVAALNPNDPIISGDVLAFRVINDKVLQKFGNLGSDSSAVSIKRSDSASDSNGWSDQWFFLSLQGSANPGNTPTTAKLTYTSSATDGSKSFPLSESVPIKFPIVINSPAIRKGDSVSAITSADFIVSGTSTASTKLSLKMGTSNSSGTQIEAWTNPMDITTTPSGSWQYKIPKGSLSSGRYVKLEIKDATYPLAINTAFTVYFGQYTIEVSPESNSKIPVKISSSLTNSTSAKVRVFNSNNAQVTDLGTKSISKASPIMLDVPTTGWDSKLSYNLSLLDVANDNVLSTQTLRQPIPDKPTLPPTIGPPSKNISFSINFSNPTKNAVYRLEGSTNGTTWSSVGNPKTAQDNTTDLSFVYTATSLQGLYTVFRITQQSGSNWNQVGENISF
jgi:hypothetical protein